jgi:acyl carrier protein
MGETMDARVAPQRRSDAGKVRSFIAEYVGIDAKEVTDETHLTDDLGLDWLDQLELMVLIEDEFVGVDFFANTIATQIVLVGDLIRQIEHHNAAPARRSAA